MKRNALAEETSPYLLQHKDNPVHWQAWGPTALAAARDDIFDTVRHLANPGSARPVTRRTP